MLGRFIFIGEKAVGHDFDEVRFGFIDIPGLAGKDFFHQFGMFKGVGMNFIV